MTKLEEAKAELAKAVEKVELLARQELLESRETRERVIVAEVYDGFEKVHLGENDLIGYKGIGFFRCLTVVPKYHQDFKACDEVMRSLIYNGAGFTTSVSKNDVVITMQDKNGSRYTASNEVEAAFDQRMEPIGVQLAFAKTLIEVLVLASGK